MEELLTVENLANGLAFFLVALVTLVGYKSKGWASPKNEGPRNLEIAGALIDSTDAKAIVSAIQENTKAMHTNTETVRKCYYRIEQVESSIMKLATEVEIASRLKTGGQ